jgi:hypothetical protein
MTDVAAASMKAVPHDYDVEDKSNNKAPKFNGDGSTFSWWKDRIYNHLIGIDDELWDLVEERVTFQGLDERSYMLKKGRSSLLLTRRLTRNITKSRIFSLVVYLMMNISRSLTNLLPRVYMTPYVPHMKGTNMFKKKRLRF